MSTQQPKQASLSFKAFTSVDGLFIASASGYEISTVYLINGKEMKPTHNKLWKLVEGEAEIKTVQKFVRSIKRKSHYELIDETLHVDGKIPKRLELDDVGGYYDEDEGVWVWGNYSNLQSLYKTVYSETPEHYADIDFDVNYVGSVDGSISKPLEHKFKISGKYNSDEVEKALKDVVTYSELERILTPEFLLHEKPCTLPSKQFYNLIRSYVKDNIDPANAKVTSDYDFCFTVSKVIAVKPYEIKREQLTANGKGYKPPKFNVSQVKYVEHKVYEITNTQDRYKGYPTIDDITGESLQDLYDNIKTYLDVLMWKINKPVKRCDCCNGEGYLTE